MESRSTAWHMISVAHVRPVPPPLDRRQNCCCSGALLQGKDLETSALGSTSRSCSGCAQRSARCVAVLSRLAARVARCSRARSRLPSTTQKKIIKLFTPKFYNKNNTHLSEIGCVRRAWLARSSLAASSRVHTRRVRSHRVHRGRDALVRRQQSPGVPTPLGGVRA